MIATQFSDTEPMREIIKEENSSEILFSTAEIISFWFKEVENNLVHDNIRFMCSFWMPLWLQFGKEEQILFYQDSRKVTNNHRWWWSPIKCKLEKKKLSEVKIWDFVFDVRWKITNEKSYILVTKVDRDWYEWMFYNNRALCYMSITALSDEPLVVVPLDND